MFKIVAWALFLAASCVNLVKAGRKTSTDFEGQIATQMPYGTTSRD